MEFTTNLPNNEFLRGGEQLEFGLMPFESPVTIVALAGAGTNERAGAALTIAQPKIAGARSRSASGSVRTVRIVAQPGARSHAVAGPSTLGVVIQSPGKSSDAATGPTRASVQTILQSTGAKTRERHGSTLLSIPPVVLAIIASTTEVFAPSFARRPDAILAMLPPGSSAPLIYLAPSNRLVLTPLAHMDSRSIALRRLRELLGYVTFRRTVAAGQPEGQKFRLPLDQIHDEMPDSVEDLKPPSIAFLPVPGPGVHDRMGLGGLQVIEETAGVYGEGTVLVRYGEYIEQFTIEIVAPKKAERRALVAGLQQLFSLVAESNTLRLMLPGLYNSIADFVLTDTQYIDDPYVVQNRRRAHLRVTMTVPEVFLARGYAALNPSVLLEVGTDIDLEIVESTELLP